VSNVASETQCLPDDPAYTSIPEVLRDHPQWVAWWSVPGEGRKVQLPDGGWTRPLKRQRKPHKLPIDAQTGGLASAYSGDVQFPTLALRQILDRMDQGFLFGSDADSALRHRSIFGELETAYHGYPAHGTDQSTILHFSRDGAGRHAKFSLWKIEWSRDGAIRSTSLSLPTSSVIGEIAGSGWRILIDRNEAWKKAQGRTARGVFSSFCDALESGEDLRSAGPPQLVGLYPSFPSRLFGIVWRNGRYLAGSPALNGAQLEQFEWRNCLFERVEPYTLQRIDGAQPQPRPRSLE
jgi:hypothetical protein